MHWEEKLFWISRGFRTAITIEIACPADGVHRAELTQEQEQYACPACVSMPRHNYLRRRHATGSIESELAVDLPAPGVALEALVAGECCSISQATQTATTPQALDASQRQISDQERQWLALGK
jgi:hypothetical protein